MTKADVGWQMAIQIHRHADVDIIVLNRKGLSTLGQSNKMSVIKCIGQKTVIVSNQFCHETLLLQFTLTFCITVLSGKMYFNGRNP